MYTHAVIISGKYFNVDIEMSELSNEQFSLRLKNQASVKIKHFSTKRCETFK